MPQVSGDRFTSQNMADCPFCPSDGRRFRTTRQCSGCGKPLCLVCRPWIPEVAFLCPDCGGGPCENAIHEPAAVVARLTAAGRGVPFWLEVMVARAALATAAQPIEDEIVPE